MATLEGGGGLGLYKFEIKFTAEATVVKCLSDIFDKERRERVMQAVLLQEEPTSVHFYTNDPDNFKTQKIGGEPHSFWTVVYDVSENNPKRPKVSLPQEVEWWSLN